MEPCPTEVEQSSLCYLFETGGVPLDGFWWAAPEVGVVAMDLWPIEGSPWELAEPPTCEGACDGEW